MEVTDWDEERINEPGFEQGGVSGEQLALLPLTHDHILRAILLYADGRTLTNCEKVCKTWSSWISSSRIWVSMLAVVGARAKSFAWAIRYDTSCVGAGWLDDEGSEFVLHRLEQLAAAAKEMLKDDDCDEELIRKKAVKISSFIENTRNMIETDKYPVQMFETLKKEETKEKKMHCSPQLVEWISDVGALCSFKTDTIHQAMAIVDMVLSLTEDSMRDQNTIEDDSMDDYINEDEHHDGKYDSLEEQRVLGITALTIAAEHEDDDKVSTLYGLYSDTTNDQYTEVEIFKKAAAVRSALNHDWYRPSSHLFLCKLVNQIVGAEPDTVHLAHHLNHLLLLHGAGLHDALPTLSCSSSLLASACLGGAQYLLGQHTWSPFLAYVTGYSLQDIQPIMQYAVALYK